MLIEHIHRAKNERLREKLLADQQEARRLKNKQLRMARLARRAAKDGMVDVAPIKKVTKPATKSNKPATKPAAKKTQRARK